LIQAGHGFKKSGEICAVIDSIPLGYLGAVVYRKVFFQGWDFFVLFGQICQNN